MDPTRESSVLTSHKKTETRREAERIGMDAAKADRKLSITRNSRSLRYAALIERTERETGVRLTPELALKVKKAKGAGHLQGADLVKFNELKEQQKHAKVSAIEELKSVAEGPGLLDLRDPNLVPLDTAIVRLVGKVFATEDLTKDPAHWDRIRIGKVKEFSARQIRRSIEEHIEGKKIDT